MRLQEYLAEVSKIKLLEPMEEQELWFRYKKQADLESRRLLIEHYQPLVVKALSRWRGQDGILMDLAQEGIIGLIESVENYDPDRGVAFSLYAIHRIRGRMLNYQEKEAKGIALSIDSCRQPESGERFSELLTDQAPSAAEIAEQNFVLQQMHRAMERLPSKERLALDGMFLQDQEPQEVALALQISSSHLYRLQKQGIRRVRGMMSRLMAELKK